MNMINERYSIEHQFNNFPYLYNQQFKLSSASGMEINNPGQVHQQLLQPLQSVGIKRTQMSIILMLTFMLEIFSTFLSRSHICSNFRIIKSTRWTGNWCSKSKGFCCEFASNHACIERIKVILCIHVCTKEKCLWTW